MPSILVWFLLDGVGSIIIGAGFTVVMNAGFLSLIAAPNVWPEPKPRTA